MQGAGGTPGGVGMFLIGFVMAVAGGWLLVNQVVVTSGGWYLWGYSSFGLSLLPFIVGTGVLFFNGRSVLGWLLLIAGITIILAGILSNLNLYFRPTSLFNTLLMLGLLAGGIGLLARSLRAAEHSLRSKREDLPRP
jgi:predicted membrane channel-forming protein YqfA (hemolysin III family)